MADRLGERVKLGRAVCSIGQSGDGVVVQTLSKETYEVRPHK